MSQLFSQRVQVVIAALGLLLTGVSGASADPILDIRFEKPGVNVGDPFNSTTNAGTEAVTITGQQGTALPVYTQGPTGSKDLAVLFNGENSQNAGEDANFIEIAGFSGWDAEFTFAFAIRLDSGNLNFGTVLAEKDGVRIDSNSTFIVSTTIDQTPGGRPSLPRQVELTSGQWHHIAIVYDGDGGNSAGTAAFDVYLDGVYDSGRPSVDPAVTDNTGPLNMGGFNRFNARSMNGALDSIYYEDRILSASEIEQLSITALVPEPGSLSLVAVSVASVLHRRRRA